MSDKLNDDDVIETINSMDFCALFETWSNVNTAIDVSGYGSLHKPRRKAHKKGGPNGGILFLYRSMCKNHLELVPCKHEDLLIVRIDGRAIGHVRDLYLIIVYVRHDIPVDSHPIMVDVESALTTYDIVTGYLHLTRVKSTNSKKYSKGKIQR